MLLSGSDLAGAGEWRLFLNIVFRRLRDQIWLSLDPVASARMPTHFRFTESEKSSFRRHRTVVRSSVASWRMPVGADVGIDTILGN